MYISSINNDIICKNYKNITTFGTKSPKASDCKEIKGLLTAYLGRDLVKSYSPTDEFTQIQSEEEYNIIFDRIKDEKVLIGKHYYWDDSRLDERLYKNIPENLKGLTIYAGYNDCSEDINKYLSGRLDWEAMKKQAFDEYKKNDFILIGRILPKHKSTYTDMVRVLDYSLSALDKKYGKYEGIVYRIGYMDCKTPQFFSSSLSPQVITKLCGSPDENIFSVIRTKSGHKICDFQEEYGSIFAEEQEILLDRKAKYRIVQREEYDDELLDAKNKLLSHLPLLKNTDKIQVFEEI